MTQKHRPITIMSVKRFQSRKEFLTNKDINKTLQRVVSIDTVQRDILTMCDVFIGFAVYNALLYRDNKCIFTLYSLRIGKPLLKLGHRQNTN